MNRPFPPPSPHAPHRQGLAYRRRVGGAMLAGCGLLGTGVVVVPGGDSTPALLGVSVAAIAFGALLVARPSLLPAWVSQVLIAMVTVLISLAADSGDGRVADVPVFYLLVAMYSFYFYPAAVGLGQVAFAGLAYAVVLWGDVSLGAGIGRWATVVVGMAAAGLMVRAVTREVDRLLAELDATAARDPLTAVLNRRGLNERLGIELTRARRTGEPLTVLGCDLDGLKEINDKHGHAAGDEALALAAEVMGASLRDVDVLARTGGDEFLILLPNCENEAGVRIADALREQLRSAARSESWPVTVSIGVASAPPLPLDPDALKLAADEALYRAKELGRDRVSRAGRSELRKALESG
ncbi:MAG TPA: GGDEF domain-containing protein [Thermoleophilaceae bacterium]|nr:GGDEF domain-containing protein [Thermoleophilaceae bacterium]